MSGWKENNEIEVADFVSFAVYVRLIKNTPKALNTRAEGSAQRTLGK
jgi:hypothetical protein